MVEHCDDEFTCLWEPKTFEEGMTRLEEILARMQSEETSLADSVKLYAEAAKLVEYCRTALDKAALQMDEIDLQLSAAGREPEQPEETEA